MNCENIINYHVCKWSRSATIKISFKKTALTLFIVTYNTQKIYGKNNNPFGFLYLFPRKMNGKNKLSVQLFVLFFPKYHSGYKKMQI
jgi:hypothetical protein